jgi:hypothetical protein
MWRRTDRKMFSEDWEESIASVYPHSWLTLQPRKWNHCIPPKRRYISTRLYGVTPQKTEFVTLMVLWDRREGRETYFISIWATISLQIKKSSPRSKLLPSRAAFLHASLPPRSVASVSETTTHLTFGLPAFRFPSELVTSFAGYVTTMSI